MRRSEGTQHVLIVHTRSVASPGRSHRTALAIVAWGLTELCGPAMPPATSYLPLAC